MKTLTSVLAGLACIALGFLMAAPAVAQEAAPETVCTVLQGEGITPGLFGLCNSFCVAQNLDEFGKVQAIKAEHVGPGVSLLRNYNRKRQANDPPMPCLVEASDCPCFNTALCLQTPGALCNFAGVLGIADGFPQSECNVKNMCRNGAGTALDTCQQAPTLSDPELQSQITRVTAKVGAEGHGTCQLRLQEGNVETRNSVQNRLSIADAQACLDEINAFDGNDASNGNVDECGLLE